MRFLLKEDYLIKDDEYGRLWRILMIKKGAPIWVGLNWSSSSEENFEVTIRFTFAELMVPITIDDVVLPKRCSKDEWGSVFCATHSKFCYLGGHRDNLVRHALRLQMKHCPLCGKGLSNVTSDLERGEQDKFIVKERTSQVFDRIVA